MLQSAGLDVVEGATGQTGSAKPDHDSGASARADNVAQSTVRRIQEMIIAGEFRPGQPIPSQRELARQLGVSRASLREALSILDTLGVLRIEPARGTFVTDEGDGAEQRDLRPGSWRFASRYTPGEVYQFRHMAESQAASLAAMHATQGEVEELRRNLQAFKEATRRVDLVSSSQLDFEFHQAITRMSRNRMLADLHRTYHHVLLESQRLPLARRDRLWEPVVEHERIVQAIAMNDPEGAGYYMRAHINRAADRVGIAISGVT